MTSLVRLEQKSACMYEVFYRANDVFLGHVLQKEDGYFDFWPKDEHAGCWPAYLLRALADELDVLNAPWDKEINDYFDRQKGLPT
jgi:hypothetical protein